MPSAPRKPCRSPGCGKLTIGPYCEVHEKKQEVSQRTERIKYDKERGTSHERGYNYRWSKASKIYRDNNPLCVMCQKKGIVKLNNCVDHIIPVTGPDDPNFWNEDNWQSLCTSCHSEKTAKEDGGFGNVKNSGIVRIV